jgi:hypothetical protein
MKTVALADPVILFLLSCPQADDMECADARARGGRAMTPKKKPGARAGLRYREFC